MAHCGDMLTEMLIEYGVEVVFGIVARGPRADEIL